MNSARKSFMVGLAGLVIQVDAVSTSPCVLCRQYLLQDEIPDIKIKVTEHDILEEYLDKTPAKHNRVSAETLAVYRKIVDRVVNYDTILMHGAVVAVNNQAYMFSAPSGTGKTTHVKLWLRNNADAVIVNGDKPLIRITEENIFACGSPWSGNEGMNTNAIVPLKAIVFMEQAKNNQIEKIGFSQAFPFLLQQTYIPKESQKAKKTISLLAKFGTRLEYYTFKCNNFSDDCYQVSYNTLVRS